MEFMKPISLLLFVTAFTNYHAQNKLLQVTNVNNRKILTKTKLLMAGDMWKTDPNGNWNKKQKRDFKLYDNGILSYKGGKKRIDLNNINNVPVQIAPCSKKDQHEQCLIFTEISDMNVRDWKLSPMNQAEIVAWKDALEAVRKTLVQQKLKIQEELRAQRERRKNNIVIYYIREGIMKEWKKIEVDSGAAGKQLLERMIKQCDKIMVEGYRGTWIARFYIQNQLVVKSPVIHGNSRQFQQMINIQNILRSEGWKKKDTQDYEEGPIYTYIKVF